MIFPWINYLEIYKELSMNDEPPTLYSLMQSIVNFNREPDNQVKIKDLAQYSRETIFNFDYPISDLFGKDAFEIMFLNHYMFRRINYDTLTSFQLHLMVKLNDIMPKYNKMIEGFNKIAFDGTVETHTRTQSDTRQTISNGQSNVNSNNTDNSINDNRYSDTPQGNLTEVQDGTYLTDYTYNTVNSSGQSTTNSTNNSNTNDTGNLEEEITIKRGDSIEEYKKYLDLINNIYSMIFKECDSLFYGII